VIVRAAVQNAVRSGRVADDDQVTHREELERLVEEQTRELRQTLEKLMEELGARYRVEERLRQSEQRYKILFDASPDGILVACLDERTFRYANPAICRMLGYDEAELTGKGVRDIHPPDEIERVIAEFEAQARGDKVLAGDIPCLRKDGTVFFADISTASIVLDGEPCNIGFFRDISARKAAELQLELTGAMLEKQKKDLEEKNIALRQVLEQIEVEKREIKERVMANVEKVLQPQLEQAKRSVSPGNDALLKYLGIMEGELGLLTAGFGPRISDERLSLSPRELEICTMIKNGLTSKEMASMLHVSVQTIATHRKKLRKKLGLANKKVNLRVYLQSL